MAIPAVLIAAGARYVAKKGLRGLKTFIRTQKEGKSLSGKEVDDVVEKVRAKTIPAKQGGGTVGERSKTGSTSMRASRAMAREGAKAGSKGKVSTKKAVAGALGLAGASAGAAYKAGQTSKDNSKRKNKVGSRTANMLKTQQRGRVVSETKLGRKKK